MESCFQLWRPSSQATTVSGYEKAKQPTIKEGKCSFGGVGIVAKEAGQNHRRGRTLSKEEAVDDLKVRWP
jgi:hypothetical protein